MLETSAVAALADQLVSRATIVTPNLPEAKLLAKSTVGAGPEDLETMKALCKKIATLGCKAVLLKGGHMKSDEILDVLFITKTESFTIFKHKWVGSAL